MIVTFHLAVHFVYYIWNTYVSGHWSNNESSCSPNSNDNNKPSPTLGSDSTATRDGDRPRSDRDVGNPNTMSENTKINSQTPNGDQPKQGEGDYHPCLPQIDLMSDNEDEGREIIYNVEPEYSCICSGKKIQFFPPVYTQRYMEIERMLNKPEWAQNIKKVVNFGCAELSFEMKYLKKLHIIEEIVAVDIDLDTLENNYCKIAPFPTDYLKKRPTPLSIRVFCGSVAHTHDSLTGVDAVIAIELIEHLFPPELESLPFTIFGFIKPKIAMFTTPNADFNVLLPGLSGFRHHDHKFEWSQEQFEDWGHNIVQRYPDYQVMFKGIGPGPPGSEKFGCCSQMATFVRINESSSVSKDEIHIQDGPYTLIREYDFPYFKDERTEEEKASDDAEWFLTNCKMRRRVYDEIRSEIPLISVMERIKYYDKENLKKMLMAKSWEIRTNSSGEEVVMLYDSEGESSHDSEPESNEYVTDNVYRGDASNSSVFEEEDWDSVKVVDMDLTLNRELDSSHIQPQSDVNGDHSSATDKSYHSVSVVNSKPDIVYSTDSVKIDLIVDKIDFNPSETCSTPETNVPDLELSDKLSTSIIESVPKKDTNLNFEQSIYETPYNNGLKSDCDLYDRSLPLSDGMVKVCQRALVMESPNGLQSEDPFFCLSAVSSSCDTSVYATPCCSQRHKSNIPKCLSLQQINRHCSSPAFSTERDMTLTEVKHKDKLSKSMEGFKSLESDLTYSSTSRVVDSGYPDSYSECNMDMDLTPEQIDDIETENEEEDASSRSLSPPPPPPQLPWLMDDVRNGDVANNNRDGEGNNLVADMEEDELEFEARIDEINNEVMNLAAANDVINLGCDSKSNEENQESCGDHCLPCLSDPPSLVDMTKSHLCPSNNLPSGDLLRPKSGITGKNKEILIDLLDKQSLRGTKSDTSISTNYSWSLDSPDCQPNSNTEGVSNHEKHQAPKLKTHNSLTTILDGCSKFSNCSLVRPVEVYHVTGQENNSPNALSKSVSGGSREQVEQGGTSGVDAVESLISAQLQDNRQSLVSVYQSAESLNCRELQTQDLTETCQFPDWLLNILVSDVCENEVESVDSVQSVWDSDSMEERMDLNYDVQVDSRGGGDPQRETWH